MKETLCAIALAGMAFAALPADALAAEELGQCGDNLRECIRKSNNEWRRTHDDEELEQSHTMCNVEWSICIVVSLL